ncbi:MAG: insulinase family protein [Prevotellaceae bacterium]|jgi:predicted Zn-dependent peptidase|nr:insulinase family protein [Prevotellaceae bacterium]
MIITFALSNGVRVIHKYTSSPVIFCGLTINTGTRDEQEAEHGMAHFLEHTLFKGTSKRKAYHINNRLENTGGEFNAFTTKEETVIQACVISSDFARAVELIADVTFNSIFPEHEINKEKQVVFEEIDSYDDSPSDLIFDDFEDLLFDAYPIGRNILGTKKTVKNFSPADIMKFVGRTYNTDQMVFSSTGRISEKRLRYCCEKYFGEQPANLRKFSRVNPENYRTFNKSVTKKTHQNHVVLGNRAYGYRDSRRTALSLLLNYLGGPATNSVLNMSLREKYGLVYTVEAGYTLYSDTGNVNLYYATSETNAGKSYDLVMKELENIKTKFLSAYQLAKAKKQFIGQYIIAQENSEQMMQSMGKSILSHDNFEGTKAIIKQIENITAKDMRDVANEIFCRDKISKLEYASE